jgi:16S rRNA (uracil1498-N3)-methyltransferase
MRRPDFRLQRLFVDEPLAEGGRFALQREQANYVLNVLRMGAGARLLVFNGRDGEFRASLEAEGKRQADLLVGEQTRPQPEAPDLLLLFAPLKRARLDYMVQKAVEMGAGRIRPVITQHTQATRVNLDRMKANVVEAAEQCGVIAVPSVEPEAPLQRVLAGFAEAEPGRRLLFCDEGEETSNPLEALKALPRGPLALLLGPEGGFSEEERTMLRALPFVTPIPLGPRVLRADTAAVAALAVVQATLGDW